MSSNHIYDPIADALGLKPIEFESIENDNNHITLDSEILREEAFKRNSDIVICDICGVSGNRPNMSRWHFENCSQKLKNCQQCGEIIPRQGIKPFLYKQKKFCDRNCYMESKKGKPPIVMTEEVRKKLSDIALNESDKRSKRMKEIRSKKYWNNRKNE